jgi:hypothetical protein
MPSSAPIKGPAHLAGPISMWNSRGSTGDVREFAAGDATLKVSLDDGVVHVVRSGKAQETAAFDLGNLASLAKMSGDARTSPRDPFVLAPSSGDLDCELVLTQANGVYAADETEVKINSFTAWIVVLDPAAR